MRQEKESVKDNNGGIIIEFYIENKLVIIETNSGIRKYITIQEK